MMNGYGYGLYGCGLGQDTVDLSSIDTTGLIPATGPDANQVATLQVGNLAQQISSSGQYALNPSTGQLQTNVVPGIDNTSLLMIGAVIVGVFFFFKAAR